MKKLNIWFLFVLLFCFLCGNSCCCFTINELSDWSDSNISSNKSFFGISVEGLRISKEKLNDREKETGFDLNFVNLFLQWPKEPTYGYFPTYAMEVIWEYGAMPIITWEPMYIYDGEENYISYKDILAGKYDKYLSYVAEEIKKFDKPIILRFAHEMNLSRYHWGVETEEYNDTYPDIYKRMYRYIHEFFKLRGIVNILWAFSPNCDSVPNTRWNKISNYYPGDFIIDIMGVDGYNFGDKKIGNYQSSWRSFEEIFTLSINEIQKINKIKPFFIFETASVKNGVGKQTWIDDALFFIDKKNITCMMWFQIDKEEKWKITDTEKYLFDKIDQRKNPQRWGWEIVNEKIKSFKRAR